MEPISAGVCALADDRGPEGDNFEGCRTVPGMGFGLVVGLVSGARDAVNLLPTSGLVLQSFA